ncbi:uncharacterized protein Dyak_GE14987 [Drosophila yakuba]|uniref:Major facilitator superfamily (MFS) profile domain-containing protein n=1 Tax=Drosophila yakuba TaxID=7245 RepID=B4IVP0_DROYA|nr:uncharacterized protein Dyak_GE14987 [Drosophila yakuba]
MAQLKFLRPLVKLLVNRPGIGKASVWHAVIVTFMHYFSWGLLTVPFIEKLSLSFGNHVLLADGLVYGVRGILGFVTTPVMGAISDFRGRKVVMLLAVATTYAPIPFMMLKSWWFFAILTVSSICGNTYSASLAYHHWMYWLSSILAAMATIIPAASNAVASIYASPENLGAVLGIISGIECLSEGLGPAFFGVLFFIFQDDSENNLKVNSPIPMPFVISAIAVFVAIVLTGFIKMETVEKEPLIYKILDDATEDELEPLTKTTFEDENIFGYVKLEIDDYYDSDCRERSFK